MEALLDDGKVLRFGDKLADVEDRLSCRAVDNLSRITRPSIDKILRGDNVSLDFDSDRLKRIAFGKNYQFVNPPTPFAEDWKNFPVIGSRKIYNRMPREEFLAYLAVWEERARQLGKVKMEMGDFTEKHFAVSTHTDRYADMIDVTMGPTRRAGGGGIWGDGWCVFFTGAKEAGDEDGEKPGLLKVLSAFRDEFNTVARKK